jgi:hypothetical protein
MHQHITWYWGIHFFCPIGTDQQDRTCVREFGGFVKSASMLSLGVFFVGTRANPSLGIGVKAEMSINVEMSRYRDV